MRTEGSITYHVVLAFERDADGGLIALQPVEAKSAAAAVARARSLASTKAGAVAFSRTGDPSLGEFEDAVVLFKAGDVPDDVVH